MISQCRISTLAFSLVMIGLVMVMATDDAIAQQTKPQPDEHQRLAAESQSIIEAAQFFRLQSGKRRPVSLLQKPVFSHVDTERKEQGWIWLIGKQGRPLAMSVVYLNADEPHWVHAVRSLATTKNMGADLINGVRWRPKSAGVTFRPLPKAPTKINRSPRLRLAQLKQQARRFDGYEGDRKKRTELRLMPRELHRYTDADRDITDGAVFSIAHGNNPEAYLMLEIRQPDGGKPSWHYALARFTFAQVQVSLDGKDVWKQPALSTARPEEPYFIFHVRRQRKLAVSSVSR